MKKICYKGTWWPRFQSEGFAAKFIFPFATTLLSPQTRKGYDIGCMKPEWALPGAQPIDKDFDDLWDALHLPSPAEYVFSSHMLEHVPNWVDVLDYWTHDILKESGNQVLLYLPSYNQTYWRPWNNRKHIHIFTPQILQDYFEDRGYAEILVSGIDLNQSFAVFAEK